MSTVAGDPSDRDVYSDVKPEMNTTSIIDRDAHWGDVLPFFIMVYVTIIQAAIFYFTGSSWFIPWFSFAALPLLDLLSGNNNSNLSGRVEQSWAKDRRFLLPLYAYWLADVAAYFGSLYLFSIGFAPSWKEYMLFLTSITSLSAINTINGHELAHHPQKLHKVLGTLAFHKMLYSHFYIEHLYGHHMNVATYNDAATSRRGESLYKFIPRCIYGTFTNAWKVENAWFHRRKRSAVHWSNRMLLFTLSYPLTIWIVYLVFGSRAAIFHCWYSLFATLTLECVNYIRHYGLMRQRDEKGVYEKIDHTHSWNSPQRISNYVLFNLQRHSDHHFDSHRPYQILRSLEKSPVAPFGYCAGVVTSLFPPVWFAIMDPVIDAFRKNEELKPHLKRRVQILTTLTLVSVMVVLTAGLIIL